MKIQQNIIDILASSEVDGNKLILPGQLDRATYQAVNKVLTGIGAKWDKKAGGHIFQEDAADLIDDVLLTGEYRRVKQDLQQFDSPRDVVDRVIELAEIGAGMHVLEPSAGTGNLALKASAVGGIVHCYELDPKRVTLLAAEVQGLRLMEVIEADFLSVKPTASFDRVVANPPFTRGQDADHVTHMMKFLKPGGVLVSVAAPAVKFRKDKRYTAFRKLIEDNNGTIEDVDAGAFKASGTQVSTVIIKMVKA